MKRSRRSNFDLSASDKRGIHSEDRIAASLQRLVERREIYNFHRSEPEGELDTIGIDFLIWPEPTWSISLQVKSSIEGLKEHELRSGKTIPCVVVRDNFSDRELDELVLSILGLSIKAITTRDDTDRRETPRPTLESTMGHALTNFLAKEKRRTQKRKSVSAA